jgi:hypothetical protein
MRRTRALKGEWAVRRDYGPFLDALDATDDVFPVLGVLADFAEERGDDGFAEFLRWCVESGPVPQFFGYISPHIKRFRFVWVGLSAINHRDHHCPYRIPTVLADYYQTDGYVGTRSDLYLRLYDAWTNLPPDERESLVASGRVAS